MFRVGSSVILFPTADAGWTQIPGKVLELTELGVIVRHKNARTGETLVSLVPFAAISRVALTDAQAAA